ncbi:MAG TPA: MBL fold metallo-hydrolase [bacterium]|nr:MBL fold metallo-hydrolase [bacterium]
MNRLKILIEGYARERKGGWVASSTTSLIQTDAHNIIVDPGINRRLLVEQLRRHGLAPSDVDCVFVSHYHLDHSALVGLFEKATIVDGTTVYDKDSEAAYEKVLPGTDIEVLPTPGHAPEHASLIVRTPDEGTVVVAQDVFWWKDGEEQKTDRESLLAQPDPFATDEQALRESRSKVLDIADWIIPGHGKKFSVGKAPKRQILPSRQL